METNDRFPPVNINTDGKKFLDEVGVLIGMVDTKDSYEILYKLIQLSNNANIFSGSLVMFDNGDLFRVVDLFYNPSDEKFYYAYVNNVGCSFVMDYDSFVKEVSVIMEHPFKQIIDESHKSFEIIERNYKDGKLTPPQKII